MVDVSSDGPSTRHAREPDTAQTGYEAKTSLAEIEAQLRALEEWAERTRAFIAIFDGSALDGMDEAQDRVLAKGRLPSEGIETETSAKTHTHVEIAGDEIFAKSHAETHSIVDTELATTTPVLRDELHEPAGAAPNLRVEEAQGEPQRLTHGARSETSQQHNQTRAELDSAHEADDGSGEERAAAIVDSRGFEQRRSRYKGWLNRTRGNRRSRNSRTRRDEVTAKRWSGLLSYDSVDGADPEEVEARIRNLSHGTNSE